MSIQAVFAIVGASATKRGAVNIMAQTFAGVKTFQDGLVGNLTGNVVGNVTGAVTNGVVTTGSYADPSWITNVSISKSIRDWRTAEELGILTTNTGAQNSDAWDAAMDAITNVNGAQRWIFGGNSPGNGYVFSRRLVVKRKLIIEGISSFDSNSGTWFRVRDGCGGGLLMAGVADANDGGTGASSSIIRHIIFAGPGNPLTGNINDGALGVLIHAPCTIDHCEFNGWFDGVHINSTVGLGQNSNAVQLINVYSDNNERHGFYTHNSDSNACYFRGCSANNNGNLVGNGQFGWGFYEDGFLGNTYIACQADSNYGDGPDGYGNTGGGYYSTQATNRSIFLGCYAEGGQAVKLQGPMQWIGGAHDGDYQFHDTTAFCLLDSTFMGRQAGFWFENVGGSGDTIGSVLIGGGRGNNNTISMLRPGGDAANGDGTGGPGVLYSGYGYGVYNKAFEFYSYLEPTHPAMGIGMDGAIYTSWPMAMPRARVFFSNGIWIGLSRFEVVSGAPGTNSGEICNQGDLFFNRDRTADYIGSTCRVSGTFGTYSEGRTATAAGGSTFTLSAASAVLKVGDYLSVGDASSHHVTAISGTAVTTAGPALPSGSGLAISYYAPQFVKFGPVTGTNIPDTTGTPGPATQNARRGRVAIASGQSSVTVSNSRVTENSIVHATLQTVDGTLTSVKAVVPGNKTFTIYGNSTATGNVNVCWTLDE